MELDTVIVGASTAIDDGIVKDSVMDGIKC